MQQNYSDNLAKDWKYYLKAQDIPYTFDESSRTITFQVFSSVVENNLEFSVKLNMGYYSVYARLPLRFDNDKLDAVSSYIHEANRDTLYAHFTIDYDTNFVYCVSGNFCSNSAAEEIESTINHIYVFIEHCYNKLSLIAKLPIVPFFNKISTSNSIGLNYFCKNYLDKKGISYSLFSDDAISNNLIEFKDDSIHFGLLIDDEYIHASARGETLPYINNQIILQLKEYLQRCNHKIVPIRFVFYNVIGLNLNITCQYENFFTEESIDSTLIGGIEKLKNAMTTYYPGLVEVAMGQSTAKEAFCKYFLLDQC